MTIEEMKKRKQELGLSAEQLAEAASIPVSTVRKIMSGVTTHPRRNTVQALERVLRKKQGEYTSEDFEALPDGFAFDLAGGAFYGRQSGEPIPQKLLDTIFAMEKPFVYGNLAGVDFEDNSEPDVPVRKARKKYYTAKDYESMPEDWRGELMDGELVALGQPTLTHQEIVLELSSQLKDYSRNKKHSCLVVPSPEVKFSEDSVESFVPDVAVLCDPKKNREKRIIGAPDFIAEILSPSTQKYDLGYKYHAYRNYGVKEYWIIDGKNRTVLRCFFEEAREDKFSFDEKIPVMISGGELEIDLSEL